MEYKTDYQVWVRRGLAAVLLLVTALLVSGSLNMRVVADVRYDTVDPTTTPYGQSVARFTRVPCWAPPSTATCTPTSTPRTAPTFTRTSVPTSTTAPPTPVPSRTLTATPTNQAPSPTAVQTTEPTPSPTVCSGPDPFWSCIATVDQYEREVARLINLHRTNSPPHPEWEENWPAIALTWIDELHEAQRPWAEFMVATNDCRHGDYGGRAAQEGYTGFAWAEIGSCGYESPAAAVQGWVESAGHHWVMDEDANMTEFGVGAARYPNNYWNTFVIIGCGDTVACMPGANGGLSTNRVNEPIVGPGYRATMP